MPVVDFSKQKKDIQRSKLMAQVLSGAFDGYDPNAQITGRAIPLHPVTALAKALQTGFGAYQGARAQAKEADLEAQKRAAMQELVKSGKPITAQDLFNSGNLEPEKLAEALVKTNTVKPEYINTADGVFEVSPGAEPKQIMANGKPLKRSIDNPELQGLITAMKEGSKAREGVGEDMRPFVAQNRDYSPGAFPRYDQPTGLMPVPGSPPQQPIQPQQGLTRLDPNSEEAKAVMRQMQESGADTIQIEPQQAQQPASPAAVDQVEGAKRGAVARAEQPYKLQTEQFKTDEAIRQKDAETDIKRQEELRKEREVLPSTFNDMQTKIAEVDAAIKVLDEGRGQSHFMPGLNKSFDQNILTDPEASRALQLSGAETLKGLQAMGGNDSNTDRVYAELITGLDPYMTDDKTLKKNYERLKNTIKIQMSNLKRKHGLPLEDEKKGTPSGQPETPPNKTSKDMSDEELLNRYGQ